MVHKVKGKFDLDINLLQEIINKVLKQPENKGVTARIEKSPNDYSKSLYVRFYIGETTTSLRISDHKCNGATRQLIVKDSTGIANICYKIDSTIKDLKYKRIQHLLRGGK